MNSGILYLIATPIGNLADISSRAIDTLRAVDVIAAEDTRHSRILLQQYQVATPLLSLHAHNEQQQGQRLLEKLLSGASIALISDAGTPLISDPGYPLVRAARAAGVVVSPIPGACAAIAALSASGLPADRFLFVGFLPVKQAARQAKLTALVSETGTIICYESPRRVVDLLQDVVAVLGPDREVVLARELTKKFESIFGDCAAKCLDWLQNDSNNQRGEFVVLIAGATVVSWDQSRAKQVLELLLPHMKVKQAAAIAAELTGYKKNALYELALSLGDE